MNSEEAEAKAARKAARRAARAQNAAQANLEVAQELASSRRELTGSSTEAASVPLQGGESQKQQQQQQATVGGGATLTSSTIFSESGTGGIAMGGPATNSLASTSRAQYTALMRGSNPGGASTLGGRGSYTFRGASTGSGLALGSSASSLPPMGGAGAAASTNLGASLGASLGGGGGLTGLFGRATGGGGGISSSAGGGGGAGATSTAPSTTQREMYQEVLATGGFQRVGRVGVDPSGGGATGGLEGGGGGGGGGATAAASPPLSTAATFMRARTAGRARGGASAAMFDGGEGWNMDANALPPGETMFTPVQNALSRLARVSEALQAGVLLMTAVLMGKMPPGALPFLSIYWPYLGDMRLLQYVLSVASLVGYGYQTLTAKLWVKGGGSEGRAGVAPPPSTLTIRARYLRYATFAHGVVVAVFVCSLPFENRLRAIIQLAYDANWAANLPGHDWTLITPDVDATVASWKVLMYVRLVFAMMGLSLAALSTLSPAETANFYFQARDVKGAL